MTFGIIKMKNIDCQMVCSMLISGGNTSYLGKWCISLQTMMHGLPASATIWPRPMWLYGSFIWNPLASNTLSYWKSTCYRTRFGSSCLLVVRRGLRCRQNHLRYRAFWHKPSLLWSQSSRFSRN